MTTAIKNVNHEVQLQQWRQQIIDCRSGGLIIAAWSVKNQNQ